MDVQIEAGNEVVLPGSNGMPVSYRVTAVRHYPVDFVELVARDGTTKRTMRISEFRPPTVPGSPDSAIPLIKSDH
ncbi:hypothetical protein AAFP35_11825 [Gordonia sp. CPCC 206044]|uniref:hypothetical protein n=1 Tax=Gordonia sp. CPCC 206044 TaxID=3140793 RepID=UPI003AF395B9